jgi:hypothetical protein
MGIKLSDNPSNTRLMYVYVKSFKWYDGYENEKLEGHPIERRVYRAAYNSDTKTYRIFYTSSVNKQETRVVISSLKSVEGGYEADIVEITLENLLDLDFSEHDLSMISTWEEIGNEDLKKTMGFTPTEPVPVSFLPSVISEKGNESEKMKDMTAFFNDALETHNMSPVMFDAIHNVIKYINQYAESESLDSMSISMSSTHGSGYNVGKALDSLAVYMSEDRRVNLSEDDLINAIYNLLTEESRFIIHGGEI